MDYNDENANYANDEFQEIARANKILEKSTVNYYDSFMHKLKRVWWWKTVLYGFRST